MREHQQDRASETRQQIIQGAAVAFDAEGFAGASLGQIVKQAKTTRGALHFHFPTKEALADAVIEEHNRRMTVIVEKVSATDSSALEQMVMISEATSRQIDQDSIVRAGTRLVMELTYSGSPPLAYELWIEACAELIRRGIADGDIVETVTPVALATFVISSLAGIQMVSSVRSGRADLAQRVDDMWGFLLPGIVPPDRHWRISQVRSTKWHESVSSP
ncbi:ScbR family autoregulator-binding transcription factor [Nocardia brasiliensis]|uniref:ScbR family autoregulator-binding transcription factor n=1 Tax=Nocardia brasiliensis TaxID=37326 RepID=UPI002458D75D|nr:ScbR family autoregulator-binding transcription factor [Nocardia brasiliensis]